MPAQTVGMDTGPFLHLLSTRSHSEFVCLLDQKLQELNFKVIVKVLAPALFGCEVDETASVAFVMQCLTYCQQHVGELSAGIKHLLLELIPASAAQNAEQDLKNASVQLFQMYCTPKDAKLAAKVAALFRLTRKDVTDWPQVTSAVQQMLSSQTSYKAAVHLLMQFEGLDEHIDKVEVITQLVTDGQENLAQQWVATLGKDYQVTFVEACVALDRLKPAARAVRALGLAAEFPNIEALYRQRSLARLVGKRLWQVALSFVGNDTALQTQLVRDMADAGELALAQEYRKQLGLPESVLVIDAAAVAAQEAARRETYMQLDLPEQQILFVESEAMLVQAAQLLACSDVIGLDVEWKPSHTAGMSSPAAILQLATRQSAVLFDLIELGTHHPTALDACLTPLFASPDILKLGFELRGDLAKLAGSWPAVEAFKAVAGVLDLRPLWVAYGLATRRQGSSVRLLSSVGLSTLCNALLGKPLDKSQQMSDWTARPLTPRQLHYAALDAYVLPQLFDKLCEELGSDKTRQLLQQHTITIDRQRSLSGTLPIDSSFAEEREPAAVDAAALLQPLQELKDNDQEVNEDSSNSGGSSSSDEGSGSDGPAPHTGGSAGSAGSGAAAAGANDNLPANASLHGEAKVLTFLQHCGFDSAFRRLDTRHEEGHVLTACETAAALSAPRAAVAKTMALMVNHEPLLVVTRGDQRVDMHKLSALLGVKRRSVRLAPDSIVTEVTGFASGVGGIPPIGHDSSVRVLVDFRLQQVKGMHLAGTTPDCASQNSSRHDYCPEQQTPCHQQQRPEGVASTQTQVTCEQQPSPHHQQQQHVDTIAGLSSGPCRGIGMVAAAASSYSSDLTLHTSGGSSLLGGSHQEPFRGSPGRLYLQCGANAVVQLSYEQLVELAGGQVADIADVPGERTAHAAPVEPEQQAPVDQHLSGGQQSVPRFLLDSMLGRLCRWLRALGVDAEFVETGSKQLLQQQARLDRKHQHMHDLEKQQQLEVIQLIHTAALSEGRLFLTRDSKLAARRDVGGSVYLLNTDDAAEQLAEISRHFGIKFDENTAMSRCSNCNATAFERISSEAAALLVPARVMDVVNEFWQCGNCKKVFWMGPKSYAAITLLEGLFTDGKNRPTPLMSVRLACPAAADPVEGTDSETVQD